MIRVVLADDHTLVRQGVRGLLEATGEIRVVAEAACGVEAVEQVRRHRPDVALLDVRMPRKSGLEVLPLLEGVPALMLTTFDEAEVLAHAARSGARGFLTKSASAEELTTAVKTVARGGTMIAPTLAGGTQATVQAMGARFPALEPPDPLTPAEHRVLRLIARGMSSREIAAALGTAEGTVKNQTSSVLSKLGVRDRTRAVIKAIETGLLR